MPGPDATPWSGLVTASQSRSTGLQWPMPRWLVVGTVGVALLVGGCSTTTHPSSSASTSPSRNRTNAKACNYVQTWAKDPMTFTQYEALVAAAGSAEDPPDPQ